jgi:hypothetical protein
VPQPGDADRADLQAEHLQCPANFIIDRDALLQQRSAIAQQQAQLLALGTLDMDDVNQPTPIA